MGQFLRQRLVIRGRTAGGGRNVKVGEHQAIVKVGSRGLIGEPGFVQYRIHEVSGGISRKGAAGAVGAMGAGSEAENQHAGIGIAEPGHRFPPVVPIAVGAAFFLGDLLSIGHQARATRAGNDFGVEDGQPVE